MTKVTDLQHSLPHRPRFEGLLRGALASIAIAALVACAAATATERRPPGATPVVDDATRTHYRTVAIEGVDVFYREAGRPEAPVVVLLHGFPTSSHMFRCERTEPVSPASCRSRINGFTGPPRRASDR
jgi:hypothetical protein